MFQLNEKENPNELADGDADQYGSSKQKSLPKEQQIPNVNVDDTRFAIPNEQQQSKTQQIDTQQSKNVADVYYPEQNFVNASDPQANNEEHELETRLK